MTGDKSLRVGIIGLGGFAGVHHDAVAALEEAGECRLVCTCDPRADDFAERRDKLGFVRRGVRVFRDYLEMLDACREQLDVVTIPTPVPLHAPMHRACLERGLAVYLEKPPTLDWRELEEMMAAESGAARLTNVGFNHQIDPERQAMKERLASGEYSPVKSVKLLALWPRGDRYYARAGWAGRLAIDGRLVLDSPLGNAMAHFTHDALFWAGREAWSWSPVRAVEAELYRAHRIEGMDTVFLRAALDGGTELRIAMSHACAGYERQEERIECAGATIVYRVLSGREGGPGARWEIRRRDGTTETGGRTGLDYARDNLRAYFAYLRGEAPRPLNTLEDCRPFVHLNDLAYLASGRITTVPAEAVIKSKGTEAQGELTEIRGIEEIAGRFLDTGEFPSVQGIPWAAPGGRAAVEDLPRLHEKIRELIEEGP